MNKPEKKKKIHYLTCGQCHGSGRTSSGWDCPSCGGIGMAAYHEGRFYYWGLAMDMVAVELRSLKHLAHVISSAIAFLFGLLGLVVVGLWLLDADMAGKSQELVFFWHYKSPYLLLFWLSIIADMFVFYRLSIDLFRSRKIGKKKYQLEVDEEGRMPGWAEFKKSGEKVEVSRGFSNDALKTVEDAVVLAGKLGHGSADALHLFWSSLKDKLVGVIFSRLNINGESLVDKIKRQLSAIAPAGAVDAGTDKLSSRLKETLIESYIAAEDNRQHRVEVANFTVHCQEKDDNIREILYDLEVGRDKVVNSFEWFRINQEMIDNYKQFKKMARFKPDSAMDRAYTAVASPTLEQYSYDLTRQAKWGRLEMCVARDKEIGEVFERFLSGHSGAILVGENGVGKNTIVGGIAQLMVKEEVPPIFEDKRLIEMDIARLVSGANASAAQERLLTMLDEIVRAGNIILYINNIENIIGIQAGEGESLDLSEVLVNALEKAGLYCIATVSPKNYAKYVEGKAIGEVMARVDIEEPETNQAIQMLESKVGYLEGKYNVYFSYAALEETVKMTSRYIHDRYLPAKAIEIMDSVALAKASKTKTPSVITKDDIAHAVSKATDIPVDKVGEKEGEILLNMEEKIHERMIGQEEAVKMISESLRRARAEMRDAKRPIANFLFLGPTGVGKTELAKTVAEVYFGNENYMIRIDMSEFQHQDSIHKMIGDGQSLGHLTEAVRQAPFSLVLLDEFEKAHPDILNLFLQVMDDGRLTDGQGRTIDFTNAIIIATSNAGALYIEEAIMKGTDMGEIKDTLVNGYLNKVMRPELINRFDGVIVFKPLTEDNVASIARLMLGKLAKMLDNKGVNLEVSEEGVKTLAKAGYDPKFGARPLRRVIQDRVENIIANKILADELSRRDTVVINNTGDIEIRKGREL